MLAEIVIAVLVSLDVILLVRAYRANFAYKPRARLRGAVSRLIYLMR